MLLQQPIDEHVSAAHTAKENPLDGVVEKTHRIKRQLVGPPEYEPEAQVR
jgi:hypothetical protein